MKLLYLISNLRRESFKNSPITEFQLNLADERTFNLDGLKFTDAGSDLFDGSLANIEKLDLSLSSIEGKLNSDLFQNLKSLRELELFGNEITSFPDGVFNNLFFLKRLSLHNNEITSLTDGIFNNLSFLKILDLMGNKIKNLDVDCF